MSEPVRVAVGDCRCPGKPHDHDWVALAPKLSLTAGAAAMAAIGAAETTEAEMEAAIASSFLRHGIVAWSFTGPPGEDGKREGVPITNANIDRLLDWATAHEVAEKANELYAQDLFRPLASRLAPSLVNGQTGGSTSATTGSGATPPRRSPRSSPTGSAGKPSADPVP